MSRLNGIFSGRSRRSKDTTTISTAASASVDFFPGWNPGGMQSFRRIETTQSNREQEVPNFINFTDNIRLTPPPPPPPPEPDTEQLNGRPAVLRLNLVIFYQVIDYVVHGKDDLDEYNMDWASLLNKQRSILRFMSVCRSWREEVTPLYLRMFIYRIQDSRDLIRLPILPPHISLMSLRPTILALQLTGSISYPELRTSLMRLMGDKLQWRRVHTLYLHLDLEYISSYFDQSVIGIIKALSDCLSQSMPALRVVKYLYPRDTIYGHRYLFGQLVDFRSRYLSQITLLGNNMPMDIKFLKNLPNSTLGKLNIGYPVTDSMFGVIAWFSPSITELKIRNLTLTKFLKIIATPRARGYYVFDNLTKLLLDFNEPAFIEQFALNEFNCKQMFPKLEQLVVDSFTYNLPTLLQLFSGTTKLQNLALNNCNSSLLQVKLNFNNTLNGRMDQEHLRSFACTLDQSNMEDLNTNNIQTFLNQIFMTRSTSLENLNLNIRTVKPLNFPTSNISLVNLRSLTLTVPLKLCLFAKFLTLLPKLEAMDIILIDTGPVDDQQDCEEEGNLILGGGSALNATLEKLKVTFYNMTITDNIGYSLAYGMVLYIAKLPALRSLLALNMEESVLRKCIGWVLANEHILNNVGHLHALKWRGIQMS